jgi:hypothetical protein
VPDAQYEEIVRVHLPGLKAMYKEYFARSGVAAIVFPTTILPAPNWVRRTWRSRSAVAACRSMRR